jgi:aminopeptidase N
MRIRTGLVVLAVTLTAATAGCGGDDGDSCLPGCDGDRAYDAVRYHLDAAFDFATLTLTATETIELALADDAGGVVVLDAGAALTIDHVRAGGADLPFAFDPEAQTLRVDLGGVTGDPRVFEVRYQAPLSTSLRYGGPRDDDPVASHLVFTDSEPDRAKQWLICNDNPADRALWSTRFTLEPGLDAISNGERTATDGAVSYALDVPLPTYLMAFALGQLEHVDRATAGAPLSVWYRTGLPVDADATLDVVADAMATFESKLGPYPFARYSVVLLPGYGGGMENATITFNAETSSLGAPAFNLNAHELAHHWFGDWVTMHTYDDVWVKEGMATLLAIEADRARRDRNTPSTRLLGYSFPFDPSEAIVDRELVGLEKYGSGPYERAAWLITQIRRAVGEDAFWAGLRQVIADHARGTITGPDFIAAFPLQPDVAERAVASLELHTVPTLGFELTPTGLGTEVSVVVEDPDAALIAPFEVTVVDADGAATTATLAPGAWQDLAVPSGGYFEFDAADVHPGALSSFDTSGDARDALGLTAPLETTGGSAAALAAFTSRSAAAQERGIDLAGPPTTDPAELAAFYTALDSSLARRRFLSAACAAAQDAGGATRDAIAAALGDAFASPELATLDVTLGRCGPAAAAPFAAELDALTAVVTPTSAARLDYLMSFDHGAAVALDRIGAVATGAPTLRLRERALSRLVTQAQGSYYDAPTGAVRDGYAALFRDRLAAASSETRIRLVWPGSRALADLAAVPVLATKLHAITTAAVQYQYVCDVARLTGGTGTVWTEFQTATQPWDTLGDDAQSALDDPQQCFADRRATASGPRRTIDGELAVD